MDKRGKRKKRGTGRSPLVWVAAGVGALVCLFVLAILIDSAVYYNKVHAGVSVAGIDLGGQTKTEAIATLQDVVDKAQDSPHHPHLRR